MPPLSPDEEFVAAAPLSLVVVAAVAVEEDDPVCVAVVLVATLLVPMAMTLPVLLLIWVYFPVLQQSSDGPQQNFVPVLSHAVRAIPAAAYSTTVQLVQHIQREHSSPKNKTKKSMWKTYEDKHPNNSPQANSNPNSIVWKPPPSYGHDTANPHHSIDYRNSMSWGYFRSRLACRRASHCRIRRNLLQLLFKDIDVSGCMGRETG